VVILRRVYSNVPRYTGWSRLGAFFLHDIDANPRVNRPIREEAKQLKGLLFFLDIYLIIESSPSSMFKTGNLGDSEIIVSGIEY
jgi:hypothetical protein